MKIWKKVLPVAMSACMMALAGCGGGEPYEPYDYTVKHASIDNVLRFYSSDDRLDSFLNEYFERHMRYNDRRIHDFPVGGAQPVWKEWESMIGSFWNADSANLTSHYATNEWVERWLTFDYMSAQDRQGYVQTSAGSTSTDWGQGWAFPDYHHNVISPLGYEFSSGLQGWTAGAGTKVSAFAQPHPDGGMLAEDEGTEHYLLAEADSGSDCIEILSPELRADAFLSPFLFFSWSLTQEEDAQKAEDLYVYFETDAADGKGWTDDRCMRVSAYATRFTPFAEAEGFQATFLPMYLNEAWGRTYGGAKITRLRIVLKAKQGETFRGGLLWNFIRGDFDDRLPDNCGNYILAAKNYLSYSQDRELLEEVLPNARRAMQFYLTILDGAEADVVSTQELVGHFNTGDAATGVGIGDGFWDAISFPKVNFYTNITYYNALGAMAYLEEMARAMDIPSESVSILGKDMETPVAYEETAESLRAKQDACRARMQTLFWDADKGRFFAGYYDEPDGVGTTDRRMDYGFLMFNLQAVTDGIASAEQAKQILSWLTGTRTIEGDDSTGEDLYRFRFAPRFSTKHNPTDSVWAVGQTGRWEVGVRNGGAVMQTSYYDLLARRMTLGTDDAFSRLKAIEDFYFDVRAAGGEGEAFYRVYFQQLGIGMQGNYDANGDGVADGDSEGPVGIDCEFLEAALLFVSVPDAFFGLSPQSDGSLAIEPNMPSALDYWRMENLAFSGMTYDCSIGKYFVQISNLAGSVSGELEIRLRRPDFRYRVTCNGSPVDSVEENGRIVVRVPFGNVKVEVSKA